jgi:hypothetical protein
MVRNECVSFDGQVDIEVSYKILMVRSTKKEPQFFSVHLTFNRGCLRLFWLTKTPLELWGLSTFLKLAYETHAIEDKLIFKKFIKL